MLWICKKLNLYGLVFLGVINLTVSAQAHPHVWVKAQSEIVFSTDGTISAIRHHWQFDEAYSSYAVQGLPSDKDGRISNATLAPLAEENATSLIEFDYFSRLRIDGKLQAFAKPLDYSMNYEKGILSMDFTLPLKIPAKMHRSSVFELFDPTYFVSFAFIEGDQAVTLSGGPAGCLVNLTRPKNTIPSGQTLSENVFQQLSAQSDFGAQFTNRALIACP
jgi:ABC-type uncharacterized transport system substrate-binding protein